MTWISTLPPEQASASLRQCYQALYGLFPPEYSDAAPAALQRPDGTSDSIVAAHSLIPQAMYHTMATLAALLRPDLPLTRRQQEMIAIVVSAYNRCFY